MIIDSNYRFRQIVFRICNLTIAGLIFICSRAQTPLRLNAVNPHYLEYRGKPVVLITSAEHYGALINPDFDYLRYLDALHEQGMNLTRIFSGTMVERKRDIGWMQSRNTLAPGPGKLLAPWARSAVSGYAGGGNKFDLDRWDESYFKRLKDLLSAAATRGIIVELTLFGNQYKDSTWMNSPLYPANNIQGEGPSGTNSFLLFETLKNKALLSRQEAFVRKVLQELNGYDNLYYEICNEPYNEVKDSAAVDRWHEHLASFIKETEASLPKKHLIATNQAIVENPAVSIANYHYVKIPGAPAFDWLYGLNKVLGMDETMGSLIHSKVQEVRLEAWDYMLRGGGVYNNLSWEYTASQPEGSPGAGAIRAQLQQLNRFMEGTDYIHLSPDQTTLVKKPDSAFVRILSQKGRQYAVYLHHSRPKGQDFIVGYAAIEKTFRDTLMLDLPAARYHIQFIDPSTGKQIGESNMHNRRSGQATILTPLFTTDLAIRITRQ